MSTKGSRAERAEEALSHMGSSVSTAERAPPGGNFTVRGPVGQLRASQKKLYQILKTEFVMSDLAAVPQDYKFSGNSGNLRRAGSCVEL